MVVKKRAKGILAALLAALVLASVCWAGAADTETVKGEVIFQTTEPDSSGQFDLTMTVKNLTFRVYQFALRYDPAVVTPVDASGQATQDFEDFAEKDSGVSWISAVGTEVNTQTGLIDFSGYIMPGTNGEGVNDLGELTVGEQVVLLYTFHFKVVKAGDAAFQVAAESKGEPYQPACPDGVIVANESGSVPVSVTFQVPETLGTSKSESFTGGSTSSGSSAPTKTADSLLKNSLILPIGSYAALVEGNVAAIYQGEHAVVPYIKGDRTYVPVRFIAERMGAQVDWDKTTRTVLIQKDGHTIQLPVGSTTYTLDGVSKTLDAPAELLSSTQGSARTMVPIRFVAEGLGYQVEWDKATRTVIVGNGSVQWTIEDSTEQEALSQALSLINLYKMFV